MDAFLPLIAWPCVLSLSYMFFPYPTRLILQTLFSIPIYIISSALCAIFGLIIKFTPLIPTPMRIYILSSIITHSFYQISFFCLEFWPNVRYVISLDSNNNISLPSINDLNGILVCNHSASPFDWLSVSTICDYLNRFDRSFFFMKKEFMFIPTIGWVGALNNCKTLNRNWNTDKLIMSNLTKQLIANIDYKWVTPWLWLIYPEGTRITKKKLKKGQIFAKERGFVVYKNLLQPRVKGFSFMTSKLHQQLGFVIDLTVVYKPSPPQPSHFFINTRLSQYVHFNLKIYTKDQIPSDVESLNQWIRDRWTQKDDVIHRMKENKIEYKVLERTPYRAIMYYVFWVMITHYILYYLSLTSLLLLIASLFPVLIVLYEHSVDIDLNKKD